jgi:hypothetical protein
MDPHEKARVVESMESDFRGRMEQERARLAELLHRPVWGGICPICGASIFVSQQQKHTEWHLRNLQ